LISEIRRLRRAGFGRVQERGYTATLLRAWRLGDLDGKPEDLAFTREGRAIVVLDTRKPRRNLLLLKPEVGQLRGRRQSPTDGGIHSRNDPRYA
jgi:hypothetical protein